ALSDIEHSVPCHGLLWPVDGGASISAEQRRIVQLAGLRLYQSLAKVLADRRDPEQTEAARRYAITFVLLSERRSKTLQGTAAELARRVTIHDAEGHPWDTLAVWLETPEHQRPDLDPDLLPIDEELVQETALEAPANAQLQGRLVDALGDPPIAITLARVEGRRHDPVVTINLSRSHNTRAILEINESHPISAGARLGHARFREMLLLEMARQICSWGAPLGLDLDLPRAQLVLLAQRIEG
ncbi:MAG: hypothetical protein KTR31_22215, partial [Myxococcales bacterium]|nr:hypothetical protein [Myxococcales bacterium]